MKNTRKLIPAFAMLLLSAVLLCTASYAWFSINTQVTASGMTVKAAVDSSLYIAKEANAELENITDTVIEDLGVQNEAVLPAYMSAQGETVMVQKVGTYGVAPTPDSAGSASTYTNVGTITTTGVTAESDLNLNNYCGYAHVTIARKATIKESYVLTPSCAVTTGSGSSELNNALRAGLLIDERFYQSEANTDTSETLSFDFEGILLEDNRAYPACLLLWYDGEDPDCTVNNAGDLTTNIAAWTFAAS